MTFGERLRELREQQGIGLRELSRRSELSLSHLQYLERDARRPGDDTLKRLARHLGVSAKELIEVRDNSRFETDLTLLLRETDVLTDEQRRHLLDIAKSVLDTPDDEESSTSTERKTRSKQ